MINRILVVATTVIVCTLCLTNVVSAAPTWFSDGIGIKKQNSASFETLQSTYDSTQYYLHNGGNGDKLEFAVREGTSGPTHWQVMNINKNGDVHLGYDQDTVNFTVNGPSKFKSATTSGSPWAVTALNNNIDVRLAYNDGYGIFVRSDNTSGRYLLQLNNGSNAVFQVNTDGRTYIDNTLSAKQIKVSANPWADYVFDDGYNLMSLPDLNNYINKNGHLPNIPSASDISSDGISVGEMQRLQMEKIEELTLHLIEKDNEIKSLTDKYESLRSENTDLKSRLEKIETMLR